MAELKKDPSPDSKAVRDFHRNSDVDGGPKAHHHTLGPGPNQAAPGNHTHDGGNSATLDAIKLKLPISADLGSSGVPGTGYAAYGSATSVETDENIMALVTFSAYVRAAGTGTCETTAKLVCSGATTHDSSTDVPSAHGRLYQWANGTSNIYSKVTAAYVMEFKKGTTTVTPHAMRSAAGTNAAVNNTSVQIVPLGLAINYA